MVAVTALRPSGGDRIVLQHGTSHILIARIADRHQQIAARSSWLLEVTGEQHDIHRDAYGKPHWPSSSWQFNYSHSEDWFALAIDQQAIGIDIESLARHPRVAALSARYLHANEQAQCHSRHDFLALWTRKEAVLKAHGLGLRIALNSVDGSHDRVMHEQLGPWQLHTWQLGDDAVISIAKAPQAG